MGRYFRFHLAVADNSDCEAETGPLATSWQTNKFMDPLTDGILVMVADEAVDVAEQEVQTWGGSPVANQPFKTS